MSSDEAVAENLIRVPESGEIPERGDQRSTRAADELAADGSPDVAADHGNRALVGISFTDVLRAQEFLLASMRVAQGGTQQVRDAVFVVKNAQGETVVDETADISPLPSAITGGLWASLIGLILGGPVGWAAGAALGAGVGAVTAKVVDLGVPDEWVAWFKQAVRPSTATLVLLIEDFDRSAMAAEVARFPEAELVHTTLPSNAVDTWRRALSFGSTSTG